MVLTGCAPFRRQFRDRFRHGLHAVVFSKNMNYIFPWENRNLDWCCFDNRFDRVFDMGSIRLFWLRKRPHCHWFRTAVSAMMMRGSTRTSSHGSYNAYSASTRLSLSSKKPKKISSTGWHAWACVHDQRRDWLT
jgi:hypothetical protein